MPLRDTAGGSFDTNKVDLKFEKELLNMALCTLKMSISPFSHIDPICQWFVEATPKLSFPSNVDL